MTQVILVDQNDQPTGAEEKIAAHQKGLLHRAFSIFIFNSQGEMMLQQRAKTKYHSGGLWTNACCSHPTPGESLETATQRRLQEEMGFTCPLEEIFKFSYQVELDHDLTENEVDHVFVGTYEADPQPNPEEADSWRWITLPKLQEEITAHPENFTAWFKIALPELIKNYPAPHET